MGILRKSALLAGCALLGACGGGGSGGGVASTPPPAPTPAPAPAPAPAPTALDSPPPPAAIPQATSGTLAEALETSQGFVTGSLELDAHYSAGILRSINRAYESPSSLKLYFEPEPENVAVYDTLGGGLSFGEADRVSEKGYRGWGANSIEVGRSLRFLVPEETTADHPDFQLTYISYGHYRVDTASRGGDEHLLDTFFYFGIPTALPDLPRSGSATYRGIAEGKLYDITGDYELEGTAELFANFATGDIGTTLRLNGTDVSNGSEVDFGTFDGIATLAADTNDFRGTWYASSSGFEGSILGSFFGPEATEFGYSFGINKPDFTAIGGGVVVGGQDTSIPPPPPPPPPTPPPPPPAGSTFPLATTATFDTFAAITSYSGSAITGDLTVGTASTEPLSDQRTISVTPDYANGTYTVRDGSAISTFTLSDLFPVPDPDVLLVSLSDGGEDRLLLFNNLAAGTGTNDTLLQLHYLSFAFLYENDPISAEYRTTALLFGTPTPAADVPRSGTATYTTQGFASAFRGFGGNASVQGQLTADFASGSIENAFSISGFGASVTPFYRVSGSGTIAAGTSSFAGSLTGSNNPLTGSFAGSFFGPSAEEAGFTFALTGTINGAEQRVVGAAGGKR